MAIDVEAMRKKLKALQSNTNVNKNKWKPAPGENIIRIVPYQFRKDDPFIELYFHYNCGKKKPLALTTFGELDPIEEFALSLQNTGDKDDWMLGKKLEPSLRVFVPIIVRGKEKEGVKFWGFGKDQYQELLKITTDPDYGDITDLNAGRDIVVEFTEPAVAKNKYGKISVRVKPNVTKATNDPAVLDLILTKQTDIYNIYPKSTYDELADMLAKWLEPGGETTATNTEEQTTTDETEETVVEEQVVEETKPVVEQPKPKQVVVNKSIATATAKTTPSTTVKPTAATIKPTATKDVNQAFDEIFN
jgi:hypothetical protein